ncbi:MAG: helicase-related protein [Acidobacteria bacterium]|nr:helicase-related protein [Acidobacteriota bacterium]
MDWEPGDRLTHRFNPDLGAGLVEAVEHRKVVVRFPDTDTVLTLAADSDAIRPLRFQSGARAVLLANLKHVVVDEELETGRIRLVGGREVDPTDLWPVKISDSLAERLALGKVDSVEAFVMRLDALHLAFIREPDGLGSFLGGRIRLFPHQLHAAEAATTADPTRWLLADEVGLGKTVEACLVLNHLVQTGRADRTLVVAPETLTVQWLGELWRKYHQVFVLLDEKRLLDVERDFGKGFNPFQAYRQVVVGLEFLQERPKLTAQAVEAGIELLIVDEAHHLRRPPGHPGNRAYRAVEPIAALGRHVLLLTATPLDEDAFGFFRLLELLRPDEFRSESIEERVAQATPLPPCTSAARRQDIGGLQPRNPVPVDLTAEPGWAARVQIETQLRAQPAGNAVANKEKLRRICRTLASGSALSGLLTRDEAALRDLAAEADRVDPRLIWLALAGQEWKRAGEKTLVFVAERETLEVVKSAMGRLGQVKVGVFHEDLSPAQRDIEVAQFRTSTGPSMLISTECGGEGRNFEFCTRLVLFDLPWNPVAVEQRIGRLDRIERRMPVGIVYFRIPSPVGAAVVALYESLGIFDEPLGGLERELAGIRAAIEKMVLSARPPNEAVLRPALEEASRAKDRVREAAMHELHRDPYRPEMGEEILARVPKDLEELMRDVVLAAADELGLRVDEHRGGLRYSIELGTRARVESLPGVPAGSSFLGTFDREEAVRDESIDFFSSGHALVEGILAHLEDSGDGRVALLHVRGDVDGFGLLAIYKQGPAFTAVAVDMEGKARPEWAELLTRRPLKSRRIRTETWTGQPGWPATIRRLAGFLPDGRRPIAMAAFRIGR